jgi:hypothetical protein
MVSEVSVSYGGEGMVEQSISYPGGQEAEQRGYRKGLGQDIVLPKDMPLVTYFFRLLPPMFHHPVMPSYYEFIKG